MKLFIKKFVLFILPLAVLVLYLEVNLAGIPNSYNLKKENFEKQLSDIELLVVGSSHAYFGIDPALFSCKAYNMANVSQSFSYDARILEKYLPEMKRLKVVLVIVSYFSFGGQLADGPEYWRCYFYDRYFNIPPDEKGQSTFLDLRKYSLIALYGGKDSFKYLLKGFKVNLADHLQPNGWYASTIPLGPINDEAGKKRVQILHATTSVDNYDRNFKRLDDLFSLLRRRGIEPVIITTPVYHTCYDNLDPARIRKMEELIQSLCTRYQVHYFNYLTDKRFVIEDYADNDHLNAQGAEKFSKILDKDILGNRPGRILSNKPSMN